MTGRDKPFAGLVVTQACPRLDSECMCISRAKKHLDMENNIKAAKFIGSMNISPTNHCEVLQTVGSEKHLTQHHGRKGVGLLRGPHRELLLRHVVNGEVRVLYVPE